MLKVNDIPEQVIRDIAGAYHRRLESTGTEAHDEKERDFQRACYLRTALEWLAIWINQQAAPAAQVAQGVTDPQYYCASCRYVGFTTGELEAHGGTCPTCNDGDHIFEFTPWPPHVLPEATVSPAAQVAQSAQPVSDAYKSGGQAVADDEHVAWLRYNDHNGQRPTTLHLCDSDAPGAFKVFRAAQAVADDVVRDAVRYRFLRDCGIAKLPYDDFGCGPSYANMGELDEQVDAMLAAKAKGDGT